MTWVREEGLEGLEDLAAVCEVNCLTFERTDETDLMNALRQGGNARLSLVAEVEDGLWATSSSRRLPSEPMPSICPHSPWRR